MAIKKNTAEAQDVILDPQEAIAILNPTDSCEKMQVLLSKLQAKPPQLIHLEGGNVDTRCSFAYYWAALHLCENPQLSYDENRKPFYKPCKSCPNCFQVAANRHDDIHIYDGRENGHKIDEMREIKSLVATLPRFAPKRVIIILEAHNGSIEAGNALLKTLEEPVPHTLFIFTVPQRQKLLPTIASRGFVLTLPWQGATGELNHDEKELDALLGEFFRSGRGLFDKTAQKGYLDILKAQTLIMIIQKSISQLLSGRTSTLVAKAWQNLPYEKLYLMENVLTETQERLFYTTTPSLCIEAMLSQLFLIVKK